MIVMWYVVVSVWSVSNGAELSADKRSSDWQLWVQFSACYLTFTLPLFGHLQVLKLKKV